MKRIGNIYKDIISIENLKEAIDQAISKEVQAEIEMQEFLNNMISEIL